MCPQPCRGMRCRIRGIHEDLRPYQSGRHGYVRIVARRRSRGDGDHDDRNQSRAARNRHEVPNAGWHNLLCGYSLHAQVPKGDQSSFERS